MPICLRLLGVAAIWLSGCGEGGAGAVFVTGNWGYTCAIDDSGALVCWGALAASAEFGGQSEPTGTPTVVADGRWTAVAAGTGHACAIAEDGTLWCWGRNYAGQLGDGTLASRAEPAQVGTDADWESIAVGGGHSCGLRAGGALYCWGGPDYGQSSGEPDAWVPLPVRIEGAWRQISAHWYQVCAIRDDASLWCWRDALPPPSASEPFEPPRPIGDARWRQIAVGVLFSAGIQEDGTLWMLDRDDQPTQVGADANWATVAASYHACATRTDGTLWCWGRNDSGQLGLGARSIEVVDPGQVGSASDWLTVTAAGAHSCGMRVDGQLSCWGRNGLGELGIGELPYHPAPARVGEDDGWSAPTVGYGYSCALRGGSLACWGRGASLGTGSREDQQVPATVAGQFTAVEARPFHACGLDGDGALHCWSDASTPTPVLGGTRFRSLGAGEGASCAISEGDRLFCSGGDPIDSPPTQVDASSWQAVSSSYDHTCAITRAEPGGGEELFCWGGNRHGELGLGDLADRAAPAPVGTGTWLAVSAANGHEGLAGGYTCAISNDGGRGRLFCWGDASFGRLGDGEQEGVVDTPRQVGTDDTWQTVSAGPKRACAIRADGSLWCWGFNGFGGLGIGAADDQLHRPTRIGANRMWSDVAVRDHTCATATDGSLWCWGWGFQGELGDGNAWRLEPVPVAL